MARLTVAAGVLVTVVLLAATPAMAQLWPISAPTRAVGPTAESSPAPSPADDPPASAAPAPAAPAADQSAPEAGPTSTTPAPPLTPCTRTAKACVDLTAKKAWLLDNGRVIYGPVEIASGGEGKETPVSEPGRPFHVQWKHRDHYSSEFPDPNGDPRGAPMPYSAFFADGGVAFHGARNLRVPSAGCVKLHFDGFDTPSDAQMFFDTLQVGDEVQVVKPGSPG